MFLGTYSLCIISDTDSTDAVLNRDPFVIVSEALGFVEDRLSEWEAKEKEK